MKTSLGLFAWCAGALSVSAQPALTIYNQNFAVVREHVPLDLKSGVNAVTYPGATLKLEADSVVLRDPTNKVPLRILEQSYRADALTASYLLSLYEGKPLDFIVRNQNGVESTIRGKVVRSGYLPGAATEGTPIIEVDGKLRFSMPGEPVFPALSDDAILKPTLTWQLASDQTTKVDAELAYITGGLSWLASYNLVAPEKGGTLDVLGWITITNQTGKIFDNANVKLMAGDVNKIQPQFIADRAFKGAVQPEAFSVASVTEKAFDEFHLYSLPRPITLHDEETKQVEFLRVTGVKAQTIYEVDSSGFLTRVGPHATNKVAIVREFKNSQENGLGIPLPKGRTRFYRRDDTDGQLQFTGENNIDHTARNEIVRLYTGDAFDLVAERQVSNQSASARREQWEDTIDLKLRNRKADPVEIRVVEHLYRGPNWEIVEKSDDFTKVDARTIEFHIPVKPNEEKVLHYRVRYAKEP
ncbi:MAG TPA: hypothetical protein VKC60_17315 [Opitutaceae bacterium]|nr:hypothetical protein [Opitutaceae bacterium]